MVSPRVTIKKKIQWKILLKEKKCYMRKYSLDAKESSKGRLD